MRLARRGFLVLSALLVSAATGRSQVVVEIPAPTVNHSTIDMDNVGPAGTTTLAAINAAGTNGGGNIQNLTLSPSGGPAGVYDTNTVLGRALALGKSNSLVLIDPLSPFTAFNARIDLGAPSTEFGFSVGDWTGGIVLDLFSGTQVVASFLTSSFGVGGSLVKTIQLQGGMTFDRVDLRAPSLNGNWVLTSLDIELPASPCTAGWKNYGTGTSGTSGVPSLTLSANPVLGTKPNLLLGSSSTGPETALLLLGVTKAAVPGFWGGDLLLQPAATVSVPLPAAGLAAPAPIPAAPALCGVKVLLQMLQSDPGGKGGAASSPGLQLDLGT